MISLDWQTSEEVPILPEEPQQRHRGSLRAALAAQIVGIDEQATASQNATAVAGYNKVLLTIVSHLDAHNGWLFQMQGNRVMALFDSAIGSVRCALALQEHLHLGDNNDDIRLRVGIHMGEVQFEDKRPQGEVLGIAAKLESFADAGGILISGLVMDLVASQVSVLFEEHQTPELKNILNRTTAFAAPALKRRAISPKPMSVSTDAQIAEHTAPTVHLVGNQATSSSTTQIGGARLLEATAPIKPNIEGQLLEIVDAPQANAETAKTSPTGNTTEQSQPKPLPGADNPAEAAAEQPAGTTSQPSQPSVVPAPAISPTCLDQARPSNECIELLVGALSVQLGPISKVVVDQSLKDASSIEELISLIEENIPTEQGRALFHVRASHICSTYAEGPD